MATRGYSTEYFVDGVALLEPDAGGVNEEWDSIAADGSGRTQDGVMHIVWVKSKIPKMSFSYGVLTRSEYAYLNNLVMGKTFQFTYPNENGEQTTVEAYCSTTSAARYSSYLGLYKTYKFDIIGTGA